MYLPVWSRYVGIIACVLAYRPVLAQPPDATPPKPPALTAEHRQQLQERDRHAAEAKKLWAADKREEAIAAWEKKLVIERSVYGDLHDDVLDSLQQLARWQEDREDFSAARKVRQELLALRIRRHGEKDWRVTDARLNLEYFECLTRLDAAGRQQLLQARSLNRQVVRLCQQGRFREALPLAEQELAIRRQIMGENHPHCATNLATLASLYRRLGDYRKAVVQGEQACDLTKKLLTDNHPDYADRLRSLAVTYRDMGNYSKALPLHERAHDLLKRLLTDDHPEYVTCLGTLAQLHHAMGDYPKALALYEQTRSLIKKHFTENHPDYATILYNLAIVYRDMGDLPKALSLGERARDLMTENNSDYAGCLLGLAVVKSIVDSHGGEIVVDSHAGATTLSLLLPADPDSTEMRAATARAGW